MVRKIASGFRGFIVMLLIAVVPMSAAQASMISTDRVVANMARDRERIRDFVQRQDVQKRIVALGVNPAEAADRVASLSNAEVAKIAGHLDRLPAGADGLYIGLGTLVLVVILVVLLVRR